VNCSWSTVGRGGRSTSPRRGRTAPRVDAADRGRGNHRGGRRLRVGYPSSATVRLLHGSISTVPAGANGRAHQQETGDHQEAPVDYWRAFEVPRYPNPGNPVQVWSQGGPVADRSWELYSSGASIWHEDWDVSETIRQYGDS
jgi:hypothetical protein